MKILAMFVPLVVLIPLAGCKPFKSGGTVTDLIVSNTGPKLNEKIVFTVKGAGKCHFRINFGDNTFFDTAPSFYDFAQYPNGLPFEHPYTGWPGTKTVSVEGIAGGDGDCSGKKQSPVRVGPSLSFAFLGLAPTC